MRTITTNRGKTFEVNYAWAPSFDGSFIMEYQDDRRIAEIAQDFDGLESVHFVDEPAQKEYDFAGYSKLISIVISNGTVQLRMKGE